MPKNHNQSRFINPFTEPKKLNTERRDIHKNVELNTAKYEDKFQKWVEAVHADGSLKTIDSITKAMLRMNEDELHNVYNINPANDKNTEIQGLSEYFKTNHSGVAPNKIIIMMLILSCVITTANCNPIPTKAQSTTTVATHNNSLGSQVYNDWISNGNFNGQNLHNSTLNGQQNNMNIVCGNQTNNNTNKFKGADLEFFKKNLGNANLQYISPNYLYASETNSSIEADAKLFSDWINNDKSGDWGKEQPEGNYTEKVFCIRGADINGLNGSGELKSPERYILEKNLHKTLDPADLIVEISGGSPTQSTGRLAFITEETLARFDAPIICSNFCKAVTLKNKKLLYNFVYHWKSIYDAGVLFGYEGKTSGIKNLLFDSFVSTHYTVVPEETLAEKFYDFMEPIQAKKQKNLKENQELASLRDWLLPMLMNGQVSVGEVDVELGMVAEGRESYNN